MTLTSSDVLFVGKGTGVVPWYRTGMPSFKLGCDWIGVQGAPPNLILRTSLKRGGHAMPRFEDYKIVILQQVAGREWLREIIRLKQRGVKVIYEVDDYLHGVRKIQSHRAKEHYSKKNLLEYELCMRACHAMIVSTPWLKKAYAKFNSRIFICRNGIEAERYGKYEIPPRPHIHIGWAGGEGHLESVKAWLPAVDRILEEHENVRFLSLGLPVATLLENKDRAMALPFISIENFPGALTMFDIAIAPAGRGSFFAAKSDLRFLETGALGIPLVADPFVYDDIRENETGLLAESAEEAYSGLDELIREESFRREVGAAAKDYVTNFRSIEKAVEQWEQVFVSVYKNRPHEAAA